MDKNIDRAVRGEDEVSSEFSTNDARSDAAEVHAAEARAPISAAAWDPYQVWLTRVQQPREQVVRMRHQERRGVRKPSKELAAGTATRSARPRPA